MEINIKSGVDDLQKLPFSYIELPIYILLLAVKVAHLVKDGETLLHLLLNVHFVKYCLHSPHKQDVNQMPTITQKYLCLRFLLLI